MKLVKSLLLGSAAGLCAVAGAQAADLPVRKAAPVEYVRVCTAYGAGFFYIPGTDTCLRVGGRARFEGQFGSQRNRQTDLTGFRGLGRIQLDARTQTAYGTLRTFVRAEIASRTGGGQLRSGTSERSGWATISTGQDTFGRSQTYVQIDKAFVQFAGITAGRASSFFDFYAHDTEIIGNTTGSDVSTTNLLAYTATFGNGFSATLSMEDPIFRRTPVFGANLSGVAGGAGTPSTNVFIASTFGSLIGVTRDPVTGAVTSGQYLDVVQRERLPDFVGVLRYDAAWGSAQASAAVHEIAMGGFLFNGNGVGTTPALAAIASAPGTQIRIPSNEYGFAVQGGLKLNVPQLAPGDVLWLQAAYGQGAGSYTGIYVPGGSETQSPSFTNRFNQAGYDAVVDSFGRVHLTESYTVTAAFLHYWTPEVRQSVFGSYGREHFDSFLRTIAGSPTLGTTPATLLFSTFAKDMNIFTAGSTLIWSPVRDLDIGVEGLYMRADYLGGASRGRVLDANKFGATTGRTISTDDQVLARVRIQRDF